MNAAADSRIYQFPQGFLWGASTSSHQVEGDNRWNDWWEHEQAGRLPHKSGEACRHYERFEQDFDLARSLGHNCHRFSIEWSRIEPSEGRWNPEALDHYQSVIGALRERGLEPVVTLHHFTNPAWFASRGGWLHRDSGDLFARYAEHVVTRLGAGVKYWLTLNEPTDYVMQGYVNGEWPPFFKASWDKASRVFRNMARAHIAAYRVVRSNSPHSLVGFAHSATPVLPCDPKRRSDRVAAALRHHIWNGAFFRLIGAYRSPLHAVQNLDFVGLNYYKRTVVRSEGWGFGAVLGKTCSQRHHIEQGPISATGWEMYPAGFQSVLESFSRLGLPLLVTENGIATEDEDLRRDFFVRHVQILAQALEQGIKVIGYLHWSLIDNFEWALGTAPRFGLAAVDYQTQQRSVRPFAAEFSRVCRENRLMLGNTAIDLMRSHRLRA